MVARRPNLLLRVMPSFTDFAFLMPAALLFGTMGGYKALLQDCDTGWHIRTGQWIVSNHAVPARDIFSFSKPGQPWFAWEWLSDVVFAWLHAHAGLGAVTLATLLLICITYALLFRLLRRKANVVVAITVTTMAAACGSIHWLARPHIFTLLFLVLFYGALERVREGKTRLAGVPYLALFPLATVLWTNLHGGFFVGILMICVYGAGELSTMVLSAEPHQWAGHWRKARPYFLSALACAAASLINPYTYHLHMHMAAYLANPWNSEHIGEFLSVSFHHPTAIYFEAMLVLAAAAAFWNLSKGRYTEPLLTLLWIHGALLAGRNIPIFAIAASVPVAAALQQWLELVPESGLAGWVRRLAARFDRIAAEAGVTDAAWRCHLASAAAVLVLVILTVAPHPPRKFRAEFDPKRYPSGALAMLRSDPSARVFACDEWGDYLIWKLYPRQRVFVDGRSDFYGNDFENEYLDIFNAKYGWERSLANFGVNTILVAPDQPLAAALKESSHWRVAYDDGVALVFRPAQQTTGETFSAVGNGGGYGRDREVTKTEARDRAITWPSAGRQCASGAQGCFPNPVTLPTRVAGEMKSKT